MLQTSDVDIYFIFTTWKEKHEFQQKTSDHFSYFILTDLCPLKVCDKNVSYVTFKKLFALSLLYQKYDYITCCDAEITFLKQTGFYEMMQAVVNNRTICGGIINNPLAGENKIIEATKYKLTPPVFHKSLKEIGNVYTWWSNVPVYDCKRVEEFLCWIQFNPTAYSKFSWYFFENMAYDYFCITRLNYKLIIVPNVVGHSLEAENSRTIQRVNEKQCKLFWVNHAAYETNRSYYDTHDFWIVFHLDR